MQLFNKMLHGKSILVPGCGDGRDSRYLKALNLSVISFDLSKEMLVQARKYDPEGTYQHFDLRAINELTGPFDGIYASGCLYHIARIEFADFLKAASNIMSDQGVLYLNMKIGKGNELKTNPGKDYPGGAEARSSLKGPRYYEYYTHEELLGFFSDYTVLRWRNMEVQKEGVYEYWLKKLKETT